MRADRLRQIAADIRADPDLVDPDGTYVSDSWTPGRIGVYCNARMTAEDLDPDIDIDRWGEWLGLTGVESLSLFSPGPAFRPGNAGLCWRPVSVPIISAEHAARCLEHAAEHGVIDWAASNPESPGKETQEG